MGTKEAVGFNEEEELLELEMIIVDEDCVEALEFLHRVVWRKIELARRGRLKSHLDSGSADPVRTFEKEQKEE